MTKTTLLPSYPAPPADRYAWVDFAKGLCIIAVVAMWVSRGMNNESGVLWYFVAFAQPFRMPDFFLISGLFLARVIDRPWRGYLDTKVVHYLYFLVLWTFIIVPATWALKDMPESLAQAGTWLLAALYKPVGALWFIMMLPVYFVATRLLRRVPAWVVLPIAVLLKLFPSHTGIHPLDWFGEYFVFFYVGHVFANRFFDLADWTGRNPRKAVAALLAWTVFNGALVKLQWSTHLMVSLGLGFLGISALVLLSRLIAGWRSAAWLNYLGRNSIVVYLGFYLPMLWLRWAADQWGQGLGANAIALGTWVVSVLAALLFFWAVRRTPLGFLYQRPAWAHITAPSSTGGLRRTPANATPAP
jgi:uncharacterized membrane protein YcfT